MPVPIAELFVSVGADISGATSGLNALNAQLTRLSTNATGATRGFSLANTGKQITSFGNQVQGAGRDVTQALTAPILGVSAAVFKVGSDFEHSFTQVRRTVSGLDDTQLGQLRQDLIDMSKTPAGGLKTASELADIAAVGGQLGLTGNEIKSFTSLVARLSLATDLPFGEIADDVGRSVKVLNLSQSDYERFGATVAALGNEMGGTERDIFEFTRRLAATLSSLGVSPDQILAISAALSEVGINPEAGATSINNFFVEMVNSLNNTADASEKTKQKLQSLKDTIADLSGNLEVAELRQKEFGRNTPASVVKANQLAIDKYQRELGQANTQMDQFSTTSAAGKLSIAGMARVAGLGEDAFAGLVKNDPARAFASFIAGLKGIRDTGGPEAVTKALAEMGVTDERQRETILALTKSEGSLNKALDVGSSAWNDQTALQNEVNAAMKDTQNQIQLMGNSIQADLIGAFDKQKASMQTLIDQINDDLVPAFQKLIDVLPEFTPDQLKAIGIIATIGPGLIGLGGIIAAIGSVMALLASPVALVVLGALVGLPVTFDQIANHWDRTKAVFETVPQLAGVAFIIDFFKKNGDEIKATLSGIVTSVGTWGDDLNQKISAAVFGAGQIFEAFGTFLDGLFTDVILPIFTRFGGWIQEHIIGAVIGLLQLLQTLGVTSLPGATGDIGSTIDQLKAVQASAATVAGGSNDVNVTINNPQVTSEALLDRLSRQVANAVTTAMVTAEKSVIVAPQPLPGQVPGTPF
jgi:TP901 family phage tail tape measure protein